MPDAIINKKENFPVKSAYCVMNYVGILTYWDIHCKLWCLDTFLNIYDLIWDIRYQLWCLNTFPMLYLNIYDLILRYSLPTLMFEQEAASPHRVELSTCRLHHQPIAPRANNTKRAWTYKQEEFHNYYNWKCTIASTMHFVYF